MTSDGKVDNILNNLMAIMSPESIDSNRIASCFNENFEANLNELSNTSEIMKVQSKEKFTESLKQLGIVEFLENDKLRLILNDNLVVLVMMNIPLKWTYKDFNENLKSFSENSGRILRLYKKSMFWFVATEDQSAVSKIEEELNSQKEKIKYDKMQAADIKKKLTKIINHQNYAKETNELKSNNNCSTSNAGSTSKLSWRKASNDTEEFKRGSKCGSINNGSNYDDVRKQSYKNSGNFTRTNGNFQQGAMRDRYNSDGQNMFTRSSLQNKSGFRKNEEIEIDLSKIHYSLKITHKYTNGDILR